MRRQQISHVYDIQIHLMDIYHGYILGICSHVNAT